MSLTTFFETYLNLTEEYTLKTELKGLNPNEEAKVMELMTSYERKGMEKGLQNSIIKVLISKFESDSKPLQEKVRSIRNADLLEDLLEKLLLAESVEEAHNIIKQVTK